MIKRIFCIILLGIVLIVLSLGFYLDFFRYSYETFLIKREFRLSENVASLEKVIPVDDFEACYVIKFVSKKGKKYVILDVQVVNGEIQFYGLGKADENFNWLSECIVKSKKLSDVLKEIE